MMDELHISSLVVHARPESVAVVSKAIGCLAGAEVHATDPAGKIVVTLETGDETEALVRLGQINALKGVLSATLVYHQIEDVAAVGEPGS